MHGFSAPVADTDAIIVGSAMRALGVKPPFHKYLLNDTKKNNVDALRKSISDNHSHLSERVEITRLDANEMLRNLCASYDWNETRAVVFLDPFGLQINFETLELLGKTRAVDVWYLVPVFAMYRQVSGDGQINPDGGSRVDAALGTTVWRNVAVVEERSTDLFDRIGAAFGGRVLDETLPLGRNGIQEFSLMFAWANPDEKAKLAAKLAKAVLV
jgi:three-Cys-motif partner protein